MKRKVLIILALSVLAAVCPSCRESRKIMPAGEPKRSVYYWKTVFKLGEEEQSFLGDHRIGRMYLRMFDVDVVRNRVTETDNVEPVATVKFESAKCPEHSEIAEDLRVKSLVDKTFGGAGSNIVYHLDMSNLSKYTFDEIDKILD